MRPLGVDRDFVGEGTRPGEGSQPVVGNQPAAEGTAGLDRVPAELGDMPRNLFPQQLGAALTLTHQTHRG